MLGALTADLPVVLWIELTSRCPFDCVFCSRLSDRGTGEHMDFELFRSLVGQLREPEIIRLNYAGESIHYPRLTEAIRLARGTGAVTEIVSAFASVSDATIRGIVDAGLHRLSISLHSMDPGQFSEIYRFSSLDRLQSAIAALQCYKQERGTEFPYLDFAFVAMESNLAQLRSVVRYARDLGLPSVSIHPLIRRSEIPVRLLPDFFERLALEVGQARCPEVVIDVARPVEDRLQPLAGLTTCEQNPWETAHVLANGDVVVCEVQDKAILSNLRKQSLEEIWTGTAYQKFRSRYVSGAAANCSDCPWRQTVGWDSIREPFHVRGWHLGAENGVRWSRQHASLALRTPANSGRLRIRGMLPCGPGGRANCVRLVSEGRVLGEATNDSGKLAPVELRVPVGSTGESLQAFSIETAHRYCPAKEENSPDLRELGLALTGVEFEPVAPALTHAGDRRKATLNSVLAALGRIDAVGARLPSARPLRSSSDWARPGISVIIPERANPERLGRCLRSVALAAQLDEPVETIVVVNGSPRADYAELRRQNPSTRFVFRDTPLAFSIAVSEGLCHAHNEWAYLLNNDMEVHPGALKHAAAPRAREIFAIASRIEMEDPTLTGVETNWTDYRYEDGMVTILERDPSAEFAPRNSLYAGGGSALFQTRLLKRLASRSAAYAPFYWEDVEWGTTAWRNGFRTVFCPASRVRHGYRRTVGKFFPEEEVQRIFHRNRCLFQLRNLGQDVPLDKLRPYLLELDDLSWSELFRRRALVSLFRARLRTALSRFGEDMLHERWRVPVFTDV